MESQILKALQPHLNLNPSPKLDRLCTNPVPEKVIIFKVVSDSHPKETDSVLIMSYTFCSLIWLSAVCAEREGTYQKLLSCLTVRHKGRKFASTGFQKALTAGWVIQESFQAIQCHMFLRIWMLLMSVQITFWFQALRPSLLMPWHLNQDSM